VDAETKCPECGVVITEIRQLSATSALAWPCMHMFTINHSLQGAVMSAARSNPEVLPVPADGPPMGLMLPNTVLRKSDFPVAAAKVVGRLLEELDSPTAFVIVKQIAEVAKAAESQLKPKVMLACAGAKTQVGSALIEYRKTAAKWDYNGDATLSKLEEDIDTLKELVKQRQAMLQSLTAPVVEDGVTVRPAVQSESDFTLAVTFEK